MRKFSEEQEKEIVDLYCNQNVSIHQIVKKFHCRSEKIKTTESKSRCAWRGRQQVIKICSYLYDNSTIYLPRKKEKYLWIKSTLADKLD